jgi:hypothetical protein
LFIAPVGSFRRIAILTNRRNRRKVVMGSDSSDDIGVVLAMATSVQGLRLLFVHRMRKEILE